MKKTNKNNKGRLKKIGKGKFSLLLLILHTTLSSCGQNNYATKSDLEELKKEIEADIEYAENKITKVEKDIKELKKEIKADIEKMIKGTVYIFSSVEIYDTKWADSFRGGIGSGVIYKGYIITNRHVSDPYSIIENTTGFYSCPAAKCQDRFGVINWLKLLKNCYLDEYCYKPRVVFRSCVYMSVLYYFAGRLDPSEYPCRVFWEKIFQDYVSNRNTNCINDFFWKNEEFEDMFCYKIYSSYLPEVKAKIKAYTYDGNELDVINSKFPSCRDMDLARLEVNKDISQFNLSNADKYDIGDNVFAVGQPLGLGWTVSSGVVSAKRKIRDFYKIYLIYLPPIYYEIFEPTCDYNIIQTDTQINPGNSGGGLFDTEGKLIGINTFRLSGSEGIGFAIDFSEALSNLF